MDLCISNQALATIVWFKIDIYVYWNEIKLLKPVTCRYRLPTHFAWWLSSLEHNVFALKFFVDNENKTGFHLTPNQVIQSWRKSWGKLYRTGFLRSDNHGHMSLTSGFDPGLWVPLCNKLRESANSNGSIYTIFYLCNVCFIKDDKLFQFTCLFYFIFVIFWNIILVHG